MIKVVGQALGEFRYDLLDEVEKIIAEQVGQLRADVDPNRDSDDGESCYCRTRSRGPTGERKRPRRK